jgi:hypothetical protein
MCFVKVISINNEFKIRHLQNQFGLVAAYLYSSYWFVCVYVCFFFNKFIHNMLHYRVILHVLVYTLLHNDCFPFVLIWMVICLLPTYNICAIYTRNSLFSLLQFAKIYRFNKL